ncbi:sensor histidine kinase [Ferruginibacter sp. SUN106]|uniref:sensor histidine kinase n=1 Tax=Ferruginibacter sp. SUN106 TaxID=2978348 RepID=UPI003D36C81A
MEQTETVTFIIVVNIILLVFIIGTVLFIIQYRKRKIEHESEKNILAENYTKELLSSQLEMQTQTMQYIGREIHDNVGQKLTLASLYTQQLAYENKAPQITAKIENISLIINESLAELRQLSKSLTDDAISNNNIIELLQQECEKVNQLKKCTVTFNSNQKTIALSYQAKNILLRIVQEFLQNSIKHAACANIRVVLNTSEAILQLRLQDDGKGFNTITAGEKGIGLTNMKKRTELIGGSYNLESETGCGTQLNIEIPLQK